MAATHFEKVAIFLIILLKGKYLLHRLAKRAGYLQRQDRRGYKLTALYGIDCLAAHIHLLSQLLLGHTHLGTCYSYLVIHISTTT